MSLNNNYNKYSKSYWGRRPSSKNNQVNPAETPVMRINTIQDQLGDRLTMNLLPSLSTMQLGETKALAQEVNPTEGYIEFPPVHIDILSTVIVPKGYRLGDDTSKYQVLLSMDEHTLKVVTEEEYQEAAISLKDREGKPIILNARVKVSKVSLVGTIFYNLIITGFECKTPMYGKNETVFNSDPAIPINVVLGYTTYEYNEAEHPLNQYVVTVTQGEEYLITAEGEKINRNSPLFFKALQEGRGNMTIQGPYTLEVAASPPPIC